MRRALRFLQGCLVLGLAADLVLFILATHTYWVPGVELVWVVPDETPEYVEAYVVNNSDIPIRIKLTRVSNAASPVIPPRSRGKAFDHLLGDLEESVVYIDARTGRTLLKQEVGIVETQERMQGDVSGLNIRPSGTYGRLSGADVN